MPVPQAARARHSHAGTPHPASEGPGSRSQAHGAGDLKDPKRPGPVRGRGLERSGAASQAAAQSAFAGDLAAGFAPKRATKKAAKR